MTIRTLASLCRTSLPEAASARVDAFMRRFTSGLAISQWTRAEFASAFLKHWDLGLRSGDALHLAIAANHRVACLYSLDSGLIRAAKQLHVSAGPGI